MQNSLTCLVCIFCLFNTKNLNVLLFNGIKRKKKKKVATHLCVCVYRHFIFIRSIIIIIFLVKENSVSKIKSTQFLINHVKCSCK